MSNAARSSGDRFDLQRFVDAQAGCYEQAVGELLGAFKQGHWMWFVYPQLRGLGHSPTSERFGISDMDEAVAYLQHPLLGPRLMRVIEILDSFVGISAAEIFGDLDSLKLRSSLTLFGRAASDRTPFNLALQRYFGGFEDPRTLRLLGAS